VPNLVGFMFVSTDHATSVTDVYAVSEYTALAPDRIVPGESLGWSAVRPLPYTANTQRLVMIRDAGWGEYDNSSTYNRSNYRVLVESYGDWLVTINNGNDRDGRGLALIVGSVVPTELLRIIDGLSDYPVIDESDLSELESELTEEMWDRWVRFDLPRDLVDAGVSDDVLDQITDNSLQSAFWGVVSDLSLYPHAESADSMVFGRDEWSDIVETLADRLSA
jgi:hypothetical protein